MLANEGSNKSYPFIDVPEGHHNLSHHGNDKEKQAKISKINQFHVTQFGYMLEKLKSTPEGDGTLLDHCHDRLWRRHRRRQPPQPRRTADLAGRPRLRPLSPGRHIRYEKETPLNNLWLSMLDRMESSIDKLGDSTGRLKDLSV